MADKVIEEHSYAFIDVIPPYVVTADADSSYDLSNISANGDEILEAVADNRPCVLEITLTNGLKVYAPMTLGGLAQPPLTVYSTFSTEISGVEHTYVIKADGTATHTQRTVFKSGSITGGGNGASGFTRTYGEAVQSHDTVTVNSRMTMTVMLDDATVAIGTLSGVGMPKQASVYPCTYRDTSGNLWKPAAVNVATNGSMTVEHIISGDLELLINFSYKA